MDIKHTQSSQKETTGPKNPNMNKDRSDSREIIFLASGLLALMLGIGGILMYSENESLAPTASQAANSVNLAKTISSSLSEPQVSSALDPNPEPTINLTTHLGTDPDPAQREEPTKVHFDFNQSTLSEEAKDIIINFMRTIPEGWTGTLRIEGHTDAQGSDTYNQALGLRRAQAVQTFLVSSGVAEDTVDLESFGKERMICQEDTPACFEQNRRAHLVLFAPSTPRDETALLSMTPPVMSGAEPTPSAENNQVDSSHDSSPLQEEVQAEIIASEPNAATESIP